MYWNPQYIDWVLKQIELGQVDDALNHASGGGTLADLAIFGDFLCGLTGSGGGHNSSGPCGGTSGKGSYKARYYASIILLFVPGGEGEADARAGSAAGANVGRSAPKSLSPGVRANVDDAIQRAAQERSDSRATMARSTTTRMVCSHAAVATRNGQLHSPARSAALTE